MSKEDLSIINIIYSINEDDKDNENIKNIIILS